MKSANIKLPDYFCATTNDVKNESNFSGCLDKNFVGLLNKVCESIQKNVKQFEFVMEVREANKKKAKESEIVRELVFQRFSDALKKFNIKIHKIEGTVDEEKKYDAEYLTQFMDVIRNLYTNHDKFDVLEKNEERKSIYPSAVHQKEEVLKLIIERAVQQAMIKQTCNALNYCYRSKKFNGSLEHVEAERALLILIERGTNLLSKLYKMKHENLEKPCVNTATVKITSITFHTKNNLLYNAKDFNQWFVCTLKSEDIFHASQPIMVDKEGRLSCKEVFHFKHLTADFEIELTLHSLKITNCKHKSGFKLNKKYIIKMPKRKKIKDPFAHKSSNFASSAFTFYGQTKITLQHFHHNKRFELSDCFSNMLFVDVDLENFLTFQESKEGFLTVGCKNNDKMYWNRRWCSLKGTCFAYWNSPGEADEKEPLLVFDLRNCLTQRVSKVERSICSRPRTLKLDIGNINDKESVTVKNEPDSKCLFFAADTLADMRDWEKTFNNIMITLRKWELLEN